MKRYKYNMHHQWITSSNIGLLQPFMIQEVTPGDTWGGNINGVFRLAPMDVPAYMTLKIFSHIFFVPHDQTFPEFPDVITGNDTSTAWPTIGYTLPTSYQWAKFGVGGMGTLTPNLNALPVRAFNHVINEYFLNRMLYTERSLDDTSLFRVQFPSSSYHGGIQDEIQQGTEETVDSSGATIGITEIKDAWHRQNLAERRAQYGDRYRDLLASYGVRTPDYRLDRPEHCARGRATLGISEVVATATSASENTGEYRGHGIAGVRFKMPKRMFTEHGTLIGVYYARPRLQLMNKTDKIWHVSDKEDLYHPELAGDTQVVVKSTEVYNNTATESNFGYQAKDEWLRSPVDTIAGGMPDSQREMWHAHVDLSALPTLTYLQQVQDYDYLFQDQTANRNDLHAIFDNQLRKTSIIKPRKR
jgi:hypothetical protein